jgi:hypothetical protein
VATSLRVAMLVIVSFVGRIRGIPHIRSDRPEQPEVWTYDRAHARPDVALRISEMIADYSGVNWCSKAGHPPKDRADCDKDRPRGLGG